MKVKQSLIAPQKLGPLLLMVVLAVAGGAAIAEFILSRQVTTSMTIIGVHEMELLDVDGVTILTSIAFGDLRRNGPKLFPSGTHYFFDNIGDYDLYVSYSLTDWPTDVALTMEVFSTGAGIWEPLGPSEIWSRAVNHQGTDTFHWRLTLNVDPNAVLDVTYNPVITWSAYDTAMG